VSPLPLCSLLLDDREAVSILIAECEHWWHALQSERASTLCLEVVEGSGRAMRVYQKMGFRPTGETWPVWNDPAQLIGVMEIDVGKGLSGSTQWPETISRPTVRRSLGPPLGIRSARSDSERPGRLPRWRPRLCPLQ
jgi:hypothetical protein